MHDSFRCRGELVYAFWFDGPVQSVWRSYSLPVQLSVRGFLLARFIAMAAWVVPVAVGYLACRQAAPHISSDFLRWLVSMSTLIAAIGLGLLVQRRTLQWLDPEGELRRQVHEQSESARRR